MKKLLFGIAILAVALVANAQRGQGFRGMMRGPMGSITRADVQAELKLTDDQKDKITNLTDFQQNMPKFQAAMQEAGLSRDDFQTEAGQKKMRAVMEKIQAQQKKDIEAVLTPDQVKRWNEVSIQLDGNSAILQPEIAKALGITDDQKAKIQDLQKVQMDAMRSMGEKMRNQELTMEEFQAKRKKNDEVMDAELGKLLTDAQKAKLKEMGGKKFEKKDDGGGN